jgi:pre-mRNA-splicing factor CWC22
VYASFLAVLHSKLPEIGELVLARSILLFRKSYARQDRDRTLALANFIGCLFNQGMCHEILCLQMLTLLLADDDATDESVEVAIRLVQVVGKKMMEVSPAGLYAVMERFRSLLHEGESATAVVSRRVQFKLQHVLEVRKRKFEEFPTLLPELDLVEVEDQIMLEMGLDDEDLKMEDHLDVFQFDQDWVLHEKEWLEIQKEILGHDPDEEKEKEEEDEEEESDTEKSSNDSHEDEDDDDEEEEDGVLVETTNKKPTAITTTTTTAVPSKAQTIIQDMSEKDLIHLRRTIYLTIMSSATFEECAHKLSKMDIPTGKEMELINMIIECCSQERTFLRYYGLIASRFCLLHNRWKDAFHQAFIVQYNTIHRLETNKLRNVAKLFAHLLYTDSLSWSCLSVIHLNEDETTSSSRIFLKILIQEMAQAIGMEKLLNRFETKDPEEASWFQELFPRDYNQPRKTRYAINFFTSIGLGPLTDGLREHLKQAPKLIRMQAAEISGGRGDGKEGGDADSDASSVLSSSSSSVSSSSTSTYSSSRSSSSYSSSSLSSSSSSESHTSDSYNRGKARMRRRRRRDSYSDDSSTSSSVSPSPSRRNSKRSNSRESRRRGTKQKRSSSNRPTTTTDPRDHGRNRRYRHASRSSSATEDSRHSRHGPRGRTSRSSPRDSSRDRYDVDRKSLKRERETSRAGHSSQSSNDRQKKRSSRSNNKRRRSVSESSSSGSYRSSDSGYDSKRSSHPSRKRSESTKFRRE